MKKGKGITAILLMFLLTAALCGCGCGKTESGKPVSGQTSDAGGAQQGATQKPQDDTPILTQEPAPSDTPTPTQEAQPSDTPTPTQEPQQTDTPAPTQEAQPSDTPAPTQEPQQTDTPAPTNEPKPTDTPIPTVTPTPTKALTLEEQLVGTWKTTYDFGEAIADEVDIDPPSVPFEAQVFLDLNADGTFRCRIDETSFKQDLDKWLDHVMPDILQMVYDEFADKGIPAGLVETFVRTTMGCTVEEFAKQTVKEEIDKEIKEELNKGREYRVEGDRLYLRESDEEFDDTEYVLYSVNGDTLVIDATESGGVAMLPATKLTFKRVE